jgi:hypothetical protein
VLARDRRQKATLLTPLRIDRYAGIRGRNSLKSRGVRCMFSSECVIKTDRGNTGNEVLINREGIFRSTLMTLLVVPLALVAKLLRSRTPRFD